MKRAIQICIAKLKKTNIYAHFFNNTMSGFQIQWIESENIKEIEMCDNNERSDLLKEIEKIMKEKDLRKLRIVLSFIKSI